MTVSIEAAMRAVLRLSANFSQGTTAMLDVSKSPSEATRGRVPSTLKQWMVQAEGFEETLVKQYQEIDVGDVRMLMAGTGVGKTTKMPAMISAAEGVSSLVIMPDQLMPADTITYVENVVVPSLGNVSAKVLRTKHLEQPPKTPHVYYTDIVSFLTKLYDDNKFLERLNIGFIYLDEAHNEAAGYYFFNLMAEMEILAGVKKFFGSATAANDIVLSGDNAATPVAVASAKFPVATPERIPVGSPIHYQSIVGRTLIFLANDVEIEAMAEYYDTYDVEVVKFGHSDGSKVFFENRMKISTRRRAVAYLTQSRLESSFTLPIDTVVCCGYTTEFVAVYSGPSAVLRKRPVTASERTQRMGRVGRHLSGKAYYNDVQTTQKLPPINETSAIYVYLWARMFNVQLRNPIIARFDDLLGGFSLSMCATLLNCRAHPILVLPYLDDDGALYAGWEIMRHAFFQPDQVKVSLEDNTERVLNWPERNTGPRKFLTVPAVYKSRVDFPDEMVVIPYVAWEHYRQNTVLRMQDDSAMSVVTTMETLPVRNKSSVSVVSTQGGTARKVRGLRTQSLATVFGSEDVNMRLPTLPEVPEYTVIKPLPPSPIVPSHARQNSESTVEIPRGSVVEEWAASVARPKSHSSSSSSSSKDDVRLRKVKATEYQNYKLYPMDPSLFKVYVEQESLGRYDLLDYYDLLNAKINFTSPQGKSRERSAADVREKQVRLFLAVIRVHNVHLMKKLQLRVSDYSTLMDRFLARMNGADEAERTGSIVKQSAGLLDAFRLEGFFVGVDKRALHTTVASSIDVSTFEYDKHTAKYSLMIGNDAVNEKVQHLVKAMHVFAGDRHVYGMGLRFSTCVLLPHHVYESYTENRETTLNRLFQADGHDCVICDGFEDSVAVVPSFRLPVAGEAVYVVGPDGVSGATVYGPYVIRGGDDIWFLEKVFQKGYSGSIIVALNDASVLGIYTGTAVYDGGIGMGRVVGAGQFLLGVARIVKAVI